MIWDPNSIIHYAMGKHRRNTTIGTIAGLLYRLYSATWSYRISYPEDSTPVNLKTKQPADSCVFGHWHGDELALIGYCRKSKFLTLSSQSKDGTIMAAALKVMGFHVARGSSSRGGMRGLVSMIRMIKTGNFFISFAVDGPTGPLHKAKPGAHLFAAKTNLSLYQCVVRCDRKWRFTKTWNKTYLPKPFAKIHLYFYELPKPTLDNRDQILAIFDSRTSAPE